MTKEDFPNRKHTRLKCYDYSKNGYYFVTICAKDMEQIFCRIIVDDDHVGRGLAPAEKGESRIILTNYGKIIELQLFELEKRYDFVKIDKYVIMPNHIHAVIVLDGRTAGASPRPTLSDMICTFKSLSTRNCNAVSNVTGRKIFQASFYERVLRSEKEYQQVWQYIDENPKKWLLGKDEYYK